MKDFETHKFYIQNAHEQYSFIPQVLSNRFVSIDGDVFITFSLEVMIMLNAGKFLSNSVRDQSVQWLLGISF